MQKAHEVDVKDTFSEALDFISLLFPIRLWNMLVYPPKRAPNDGPRARIYFARPIIAMDNIAQK